MNYKEMKAGSITHPRTLHVHIGIPKTASTWLQSKIFPQLDHLNYIDCTRVELFKDKRKFQSEPITMGSLFKMSSKVWAELGDELFENFSRVQESNFQAGRDLLISDEDIGRKGSRPLLLAAHLKEFKRKAFDLGYEKFNVICVIRRQDHWLASHYAQMSNRNPESGQSNFEQFVQKKISPYESRYLLGMLLDYSVLYDQINVVTDTGSLLFIPYEELEESPKVFLQSILKCVSTPTSKIEEICKENDMSPINVRSEKGGWKLRPLRSDIAGIKRPFLNFIKRDQMIELSPKFSKLILQAYSKSNEELDRKTKLNLKYYGYC